MPLDSKTQQIYTTLKGGGADVGTEQEFNDYFFAKGKQGYQNRLEVWNTLKNGGADVGKSYEEFAGWLQLRPRGSQTPAAKPQQSNPAPATQATPWQAAMARRRQAQQQPRPTDYLHRPEMDQQDILSGQALKNVTNQRKEDVAQVLNQGMEQVMQEESRRQQPVVKTNTPADQYVIKNQGQWENEVRDSAAKSAKDLFGIGVDYEVGRVMGKAHDRWEKQFDPAGIVGEYGAMDALRRANQEIDPERLSKDLSAELQNRLGGWLHKEDKVEAMMSEAKKLGVSPDDYAEMVVNNIVSQAQQRLDQKVMEGYMPKGTADYIINGLHDSLIGTLFDMGTMTKGQRQMMQRANQEYSQQNKKDNYWGGTVTDLVRGGVGFMGDAPVFGVLGKVASPMVRGTGALLERMGINTTLGMSDAAFNRLSQAVLNNSSWLQRMKFGAGRAIAGSAYNFGLYEGTSNVVNDLSVGEDTSLGTLAGDFIEGFAKGSAKGAVLGATSRPFQAVSPRFGVRSDMGIGQKILVGTGKGALATGNIMAEGLGFTAGEYLVDKDARERVRKSDNPMEVILQDTMENTMMAGIFKMMNGHNMLHPVESLKRAFEAPADSRFNFQNWQKKEIEDAYGGKFLSTMESIARSADAERNTKMSRFYEDFMNRNDISWDTKNKVSAILTGNMAMFPPIPSRISIDNDKKEVVAMGRNGEVLFRREFETPEEAETIKTQLDMSRDEKMLHNLMGTFLVKDEEGNVTPESQKQLDDTIAQVGYETALNKEGMINALNKAPEKRSEMEQYAVDELYDRLYDIRFPANQPHPAQDHQNGREIADKTLNIEELDPVKNPNGVEPGKYDQLTQAYDEANNALAAAFKNNDTFYQFVKEQRANGLSDGEIALEARKMAFGEDEAQALIDYERAKEQMDGYVELTGERIGEYVSNEVSNMAFKGELDGQPVKDRFVRVVDDEGNEYYLRTGKVTIGEDGRLVSTDGSGTVIVRDAEGKDKMVMADTVRMMPEDPANPMRDDIAAYSEMRTTQLQEAISLAIDADGKLQQSGEPKSQGQMAYEQEQGDVEQNGGLVKNELADQTLSETLRGSLHALGRRIGKKIQVVTKDELKQINPSAPDNARGMRSVDNKTLYLVSDYVKDNEYMQRFVTGHELTHSIKTESGDAKTWNAFVDAVRAHMGDKSFDEAVKDVEELYENSGVHLDRDAAIEEVCSDWAGNNLTQDEASIRHIVESVERAGRDSVTFTQRIKQLFEDMIAAITGSGRTLSNDEKAQLEKLIKARDIWEQMYNECVAKKEARDKAAEEAANAIPVAKNGRTKEYHKVDYDRAIDDILKRDNSKVSWNNDPIRVADSYLKAAQKSLEELDKKEKTLAKRAKEEDYDPDELEDISNGTTNTDMGKYFAKKAEIEEKIKYYNNLKARWNQRVAEEMAARGGGKPPKGNGSGIDEGVPEAEVPEWRFDTPEAARKRGYKKTEGYRVNRPEEKEHPLGMEVEVQYSTNDKRQGYLTVSELGEVQGSHTINGQRNPLHFIPEAQPKEEFGADRQQKAQQNATEENFRPEMMLTFNGVQSAYSGSTSQTNKRGEVIQGNGRRNLAEYIYAPGNEKVAERYRQYLMEHAEELGTTAEEIAKMEKPFAHIVIDVTDAEAIKLGQYKASDLESGGKQIPEAGSTIKKIGKDFGSFANIVQRSEDPDASFAERVEQNFEQAIDWLYKRGAISTTEAKSLLEDKEAGKTFIKNMLTDTLFRDAPEGMRTMFNELPSRIQNALLSAIGRDATTPEGKQLRTVIQQSIQAFHELSVSSEQFAGAKGKFEDRYAQVSAAVNDWLRQINFDGTVNSEKFSNFAIELAKRFKSYSDQKTLQRQLNEYYDLVNGTEREVGMFDAPAEQREYTSTEAIKKVFGVDYEPNKNIKNGRELSNALAGDGEPGQEGRSGESGNPPSRESDAQGAGSADNRGGTDADGWYQSAGAENVASNGGASFSLSSEIEKKYPNWMDDQTSTEKEGSKRGQNTQVATTKGTYKKVGDWIGRNLGKDKKILDASSGLGLGTLELRKAGFDVDDIEPYPGKGREEQPTYGGQGAYQKAMDDGKQYDYIISNAVLNVIPDDWRNGVLHDMATLLKPGGKMFINTRKAGEEKSIKNKVELESPQEVLVGTPDKITSYQRFFTPTELKEYVEKELGDGYSVEVANTKNSGTNGLAAVVVTKEGGEQPKFSIDTSDPIKAIEQSADQFRKEKEEERVKVFHDMIDDLFTNPDFDKTAHSRQHYDLGDTPDFMKKLGISGENFTLQFKNIKTHIGKDADHNLTAKEWHELPAAIKRPFLITTYGNGKGKFRLYTSIKVGNKFAVVGVDVVKVNKGKDVPMLELNRIKTVFGRDRYVMENGEKILAYDENITPEQEALLRGHNFREYPSIQELSDGKDSKNSYSLQEKGEKSSEFNTSDPMGAISQAAESFGNDQKNDNEDRRKEKQMDIISRSNPMHDDIHTGIRSVEDIKTFDEAYNEGKKTSEEGGWKEWASCPDITNDMIEEARKTGRINVYSSKPIEDGAFVTPSKMMAKDYAGEGQVYIKRVPLEDVAWINLDEGQYAKVSKQTDKPKFSLSSDEEAEKTKKIFDATKKLFGTTRDIREAGYVLPDGTMPDFSGRHLMDPGSDTSFLRGRRTTDHREVQSIAYEKDGNTKTGIETDMPDFIRRGAIRIDDNSGSINLATKPTDKQKSILRQLIARNDGYVQVDFGDGWDSDHYVEYDGAKPLKVIADIDRYFDEGIKPQSELKFSLVGVNGAEAMDKAEGKTVRMDNLKVAEDMEKAGRDKKAIWMATGWARGKEGKWRYEIPDFKTFSPRGDIEYRKNNPISNEDKLRFIELNHKKIDGEEGWTKPISDEELQEWAALKAKIAPSDFRKKYGNLSDFIESPELFEAYPQLKDMPVEIDDLGGEFSGMYTNDGRILLDESNIRKILNGDVNEAPAAASDLKDTLVHEIQHAIQDIEGFAHGDNSHRIKPEYAKRSEPYLELEDFLYDTEGEKPVKMSEIMTDSNREWLKLSDEAKDVAEKLVKDNEGIDNTSLLKLVQNKLSEFEIGDDVYNRSAGEVEARNVEKRRLMGSGTRKKRMPEITEDVPRDEQIVYMGNDPMEAIEHSAKQWKEERRVLGTRPRAHAETSNGGRMAIDPGKEPTIEDEYAHYSLAPSPTNTPLQTDENRRYHDMIGGKAFDWIEAHQNDLQSVIAMQKAILGDDVDPKDYENVFYVMNHMGGVVMQKENNYVRHYYSHINDAANEAAAKLRGDNKMKKYSEAMDEVEDYIMMKHGLERNRALYVRDNADDQAKADFADLTDSLYNDLQAGKITFADYLGKMDEFIRSRVDRNYKADEHDMSGLSNKNANGYDDAAMTKEVMDTETVFGKALTDELWHSINAATDYILNERYESGLMSKAEKERLERQWHFYVPLQGWAEPTAEEMFDYTDHMMTSVGSPVLKRAGGRTSKADDPLAMIGANASRLIRDAELNRVHQTAVRLARGHAGNGLLEEMQTWYEKKGTDAQGNPIWEEAFPQWSPNATADDITLAIEQFNADMAAKQQRGDARKTKRGLNIRYPMAVPSHLRQHIVNAWIGGEKVRLYVQGNPRAAQALNGELRKGTDNRFVKGWDAVNRLMMGLNTSYNPEFIVSNGERDLEMAVNNLIVKEGREYTGRFLKNYFGIGGGNTKGNTGLLSGETLGMKNVGKRIEAFNGIWNRYYNGTLDMSKDSDRMFKEFMDNGGPTGYVTNQNLDKYKKELYKGVREKDGNIAAKAMTKLLADPFSWALSSIEELNTRVENLTRFAAYQTSRQGGRSILQSIHDAKEVSVNFGTRGAGGNTKGWAGGTAAWGRHTFYFYNAGVQSLEMYARNIRKHPIKGVSTMMLKPFVAGFAVALWNILNGSDDDTGMKSYAQLNPWVRRNNLIIPAGDGAFWTYPLPIEIRAFYGMGEAAAGMFFEETRDPNPALTMAGQITQMTPIDILSYMSEQPKDITDFALRFGTALLPSVIQSDIVQPAVNMNFYGAQLEREPNPFDEFEPRWQRTLMRDQNTSIYRGLKWLEQNTRKSPSENSDPDSPEMTKQQKGFVDISPAIAKHMIDNIFGGTGAWVMRLGDATRNGWEWIKGEGENPMKESRGIPFVRTNYRSATKDKGEGRQRARMYDLKKMMKNVEDNIKFYGKDKDVNPLHNLRFKELWDSEEGQLYREFYQGDDSPIKAIDRYDRKVKAAPEGEAKRNAQERLNEMRKVLLEQIDAKQAQLQN